LKIAAMSGLRIVMTVDQRHSRHSSDAVASAARELNRSLGSLLVRRFVRTAGDEMQAVAERFHVIPPLISRVSRGEAFWVGVGVAAADEPLGRTARESRGEAFWLARDAVEKARKESWGFAIEATTSLDLTPLQDTLVVHSLLVRRRTAKQHEAVSLVVDQGLNAAEAAQEVGISVQSMWERVRAAAVQEELAARRLDEWVCDQLQATWSP
jgi:hypothetical protein